MEAPLVGATVFTKVHSRTTRRTKGTCNYRLGTMSTEKCKERNERGDTGIEGQGSGRDCSCPILQSVVVFMLCAGVVVAFVLFVVVVLDVVPAVVKEVMVVHRH